METCLCNVRIGGLVIDVSGRDAVIYKVTEKSKSDVSLVELGTGSVKVMNSHTTMQRLEPSQAKWLLRLISERSGRAAYEELAD